MRITTDIRKFFESKIIYTKLLTLPKEAKAALLAKFEAQAAQAAKATIDKALL
jgi:hypothetical protein